MATCLSLHPGCSGLRPRARSLLAWTLPGAGPGPNSKCAACPSSSAPGQRCQPGPPEFPQHTAAGRAALPAVAARSARLRWVRSGSPFSERRSEPRSTELPMTLTLPEARPWGGACSLVPSAPSSGSRDVEGGQSLPPGAARGAGVGGTSR